MKLEDEEWIGVDQVGERIKDRGDVLADVRAVRTAAGELHRAPAFRKELNAEAGRDVGDVGRKRSVEELCDKHRVARNGAQERLRLFRGHGRQRNPHFIGVIRRAVHEGLDRARLRVPLAARDAARVAVGLAAREAVGVVYGFKCSQPGGAPPGIAVSASFCHVALFRFFGWFRRGAAGEKRCNSVARARFIFRAGRFWNERLNHSFYRGAAIESPFRPIPARL